MTKRTFPSDAIDRLIAAVERAPFSADGPHLSDDEFITFLFGKITDASEQQRIELHLLSCEHCCDEMEEAFVAAGPSMDFGVAISQTSDVIASAVSPAPNLISKASALADEMIGDLALLASGFAEFAGAFVPPLLVPNPAFANIPPIKDATAEGLFSWTFRVEESGALGITLFSRSRTLANARIVLKQGEFARSIQLRDVGVGVAAEFWVPREQWAGLTSSPMLHQIVLADGTVVDGSSK